MRVYKRGDVYWFELVFNGERIQRSTKSKNQRLAGQIASAYHTALIKGEVGIVERKPAPAFDVAMKAFLSWSAHEHAEHPNTTVRSKTSSKPLLRYFKATPLDRISADDVETYKSKRSSERAQRTKRRLRPATVNRELACLREMFNFTLKGHPELRNPVSKVGVKLLAEDNLQDRVLNFAEQRAYLAAASELLADVAGIMLETGCRPGEVYALRVSEVNLDEGFFRVVKAKTKAGKRRIELTAECRRILTKRIASVGTGYIFPHEDDAKRHIPKVDTQHTAAMRSSKVKRFRLYDLRHTWATRAAESGIDLVTLAAMMGHSRIQMVMRYAHPSQLHQTSAMEKLAAFNVTKEAKEKARTASEEASRDNPGLHIVARTA